MNLKEIITVSGKSGLYKMISRGNNNVIVESLLDKTRMPIFASMQASSLSDICMFTDSEDIPLEQVIKNLYVVENGGKTLDAKKSTPEALKNKMAEVLPEYDRERVHVSDMKKLFTWYNILQENNLLVFDEEKEEKKEE
ncbi:MAG: DUF5606 domain-containing protein [Bacteroidales bacterium]|nr:DUF5606 domain-containing protein [Bacteroidales bacterium]